MSSKKKFDAAQPGVGSAGAKARQDWSMLEAQIRGKRGENASRLGNAHQATTGNERSITLSAASYSLEMI